MGLIRNEETKKERAKKALVKMGVLEKDGSLTKRSYLTLLLIGTGYAFILLFSFLLGHFGETAVALLVFLSGILGALKIGSLQKKVTQKGK